MDGFGIPRPRRAVENSCRDEGSGIGLPRRGRAGTGVRTAFFGSQPTQVSQIRSWCKRGARVPAYRAFPILLVASELVTNAWLHTASGSKGGRVKIQMRHLPGHILGLAVTDDGPRPGQASCLPHLPPEADPLATCGRGLRLVDRLCVEWGWQGEPGRPLTVWAHIDPYTPVLDAVEA